MSDNQATNPDPEDYMREQVSQALDKCASLLSEFGPYQIFINYERSDGDTAASRHGGGNMYARIGQVHEWLAAQNPRSMMEVRSDDDED